MKLKISDIIELLQAEVLTQPSEAILTSELSVSFASDLMSDVLAYVNEDVLLITGLAHVQVLRTCEMLDINVVLCTRGKPINEEMIELANQTEILLLQTALTTYEVCGILYKVGFKGVTL